MAGAVRAGLNGFKYGEIPPPPGQRRKLQWWEPVWYTYLAISIPAWYITFYGKPLEAQGIRHWARPRAEREIDEDNKVLDKVAESPELLERVKKAAVACGMIEDEAYDLVLMRREWVMRKRLHDGTYPAEVQELFDELEQLSRA